MNQQAINDQEWQNPERWKNLFYSSSKDSRLWVPKKNPTMGWTVNLGHKYGKIVLISSMAVPIILMFGIIVWLKTTLGKGLH